MVASTPPEDGERPGTDSRPPRHLDFGLLICRTVRESVSVVSSCLVLATLSAQPQDAVHRVCASLWLSQSRRIVCFPTAPEGTRAP